MKKINIFYMLASLILLYGCNKNDNIEFTDTPIIETYLYPGDYFRLKVNRQIPFYTDVDYSEDDINNLSIAAYRNNEFTILTSIGDGNYIDSNFIVAINDYYNIEFEFNQKNISAYTYIPTKPQNFTQSSTTLIIEAFDTTNFEPPTIPDPVELSWDNPDGDYYIVVVENIELAPSPINDFGDEDPPSNIFRKSPTNGSSEELTSREFLYYGTHRIILYHVLPDYAALYNNNNTSSQNLTNPSTSIINGYGIFTGLNSDTLYLEVKKD